MKVIIVGGVAGGATAATRIRRLDESAEIVIYEKSSYMACGTCGLPYFIGGVVEDIDNLLPQSPESFWQRYRVNVKLRHEVLAINSEKRLVTLINLNNNEILTDSYDKLLLAPGSKPVSANLFNSKINGLFQLHNIEDGLRIRDFIANNEPKTAVIVGGGYIGIEMAENLTQLGIKVTIIQQTDQLMNTLDYDMAALLLHGIRQKGVEVMLSTTVNSIEPYGNSINLHLENWASLTADMVLLAIGVVPETQMAQSAGIKIGIRKSIVVNSKLETSVPDIYAVGDAVEVMNYINGKKALFALAGPAHKQARIAANNICGGSSRYRGCIGTSVIKVFDMTVASIGLTEKAALESDFDFSHVVLSPFSNATFYPGFKAMTMKIVFDRNSQRLLGAQIVGYKGVDKRIDVLATAIYSDLKGSALKDLDLSYAPPYSSPKDPINVAGCMIDNICSGKIKQFYYNQLMTLKSDDTATLLDVRQPLEYRRGHVDGFINIPLDELRERISELDRNKPVFVICHSGMRSYLACCILRSKGYNCYNFSGGYRFYEIVKQSYNQRITK